MKNISEEKGAIPPEYGKENSTLICILSEKKRYAKSYNKYLQKNMGKEYTGEIVYITDAESKTEKYADLDKYRYLFFRDHYQSPTSEYMTSKFYIIDRKLDKTYKCKMTSGAFGKLILGYAIQLEKKRNSWK
ncbi:MAG: hypothetical protein COA97_13310 [Flavobacteriales bacterium]|nr:MAG: hypothetical protein COA97_13310 [Flavobacteriales bacterium]